MLDLIEQCWPQAQAWAGPLGWGVLIGGMVVWLFGIAIARAAVMLAMGGMGALWGVAGAASAGLPAWLGAAAGFLMGAAGGWASFRQMQALGLALCLGAGAVGIYYHWHVPPTPARPVETVALADLVPAATQLPSIVRQEIEQKAGAAVGNVRAIDRDHLLRMAVAGTGMAVIGLLLGMIFPRGITIAATALLGAAAMLAAGYFLTAQHAPQYAAWWPAALTGRYTLLGGVALAGMTIQWSFFVRRSDRTGNTSPSAAPRQDAR